MPAAKTPPKRHRDLVVESLLIAALATEVLLVVALVVHGPQPRGDTGTVGVVGRFAANALYTAFGAVSFLLLAVALYTTVLAIVRREVGSPNTIKYTLSNAPADTPLLRLAQMQGQRYWVERTFEDAKGECGLADYQALGWRAWHHHVTMVMLAMLFIAEQRAAHQPGLELLTPRDIVEILKETLPRKPQGREALVARINQRHARRRGAIESRYRTQQKAVPP